MSGLSDFFAALANQRSSDPYVIKDNWGVGEGGSNNVSSAFGNAAPGYPDTGASRQAQAAWARAADNYFMRTAAEEAFRPGAPAPPPVTKISSAPRVANRVQKLFMPELSSDSRPMPYSMPELGPTADRLPPFQYPGRPAGYSNTQPLPPSRGGFAPPVTAGLPDMRGAGMPDAAPGSMSIMDTLRALKARSGQRFGGGQYGGRRFGGNQFGASSPGRGTATRSGEVVPAFQLPGDTLDDVHVAGLPMPSRSGELPPYEVQYADGGPVRRAAGGGLLSMFGGGDGGMGGMLGGGGGGGGLPYMSMATDLFGIGQEAFNGDQGITQMPDTPYDPAAGLWHSVSGGKPATEDEGGRLGHKVGNEVGDVASMIFPPAAPLFREGFGRLGSGVGEMVQGNFGKGVQNLASGTPFELLFHAARGGSTPGYMRGGYPELFDKPVRRAFSTGGDGNFVRPDGHGNGRSDHIDALLSPGEYVMDAETTSMLGDGDNEAGAKKLDGLRKRVRQHKGRALAQGKFSPKAKQPEQYMGEKLNASDRLAHGGMSRGFAQLGRR
jgi:hypothetical protein